MQRDKIGFAASEAPEAKSAYKRLTRRYAHVPPEQADVVISLGGDGMMLQTLHRFGSGGKLIYGMNRGSVGFLTNEYHESGLLERLHDAEVSTIHPLKMEAETKEGAMLKSIAFNEVSLLRQIHQAAKLRISIDDKVRLEELICDGALVSTPAGSTAYNLSAHGPILPIDSPLLALTPISAFRPRRWRGAILPRSAKVLFEILEPDKRPVAAVADHIEARNVVTVKIFEDRKRPAKLLFDNGHNLAERVLAEQFRF